MKEHKGKLLALAGAVIVLMGVIFAIASYYESLKPQPMDSRHLEKLAHYIQGVQEVIDVSYTPNREADIEMLNFFKIHEDQFSFLSIDKENLKGSSTFGWRPYKVASASRGAKIALKGFPGEWKFHLLKDTSGSTNNEMWYVIEGDIYSKGVKRTVTVDMKW